MNDKTKKINKNIKQPQVTITSKKSYNVPVLATICFLFAFILYSNTLKHSYVLDDNGAITKNWIVTKGVQSIPIILKTTYRYGVNDLSDNIYRPLSLIMFAIEWQISPNNPHLSHFINVLFYALSCFLLFIVLHKYMSKVHTLIPLVITLLYAAHPIHTEVVANIKSRDEIMSFFFLMLTLLFLHIWFTKTKWWSLIVSLLLFFLAFLSKEGVITMLFIFPIIGWYFTEAKAKTILTGSLLLILPAITYISIRHQIVSRYSVSSSIPIIDNFLIRATDITTHFATAIMLLGKYLLLTIFPYQLVCDYSYNQIPIVGLSNPLFISSFFIYLALCIYVILNFRKRDPLIFGLLLFLITISMYSNIFFHIGTSFAERLMFLPSLGLCIAFVFLIVRLLYFGINNKIQQSLIEVLRYKPVFTSICIIILIAFSIKTVVRAAEWKNRSSLFSNDIKRSPNSANLCIWWGNTLFEKAEKEVDQSKKDTFMHQALSQFKKGLSIYPQYYECYSQLSLVYLELGDMNKAMSYANNALKLDSTSTTTLYNIGLLYYKSSNFKEAITDFNKLIEINPNHSLAYNYRGFSKFNLKDFTGAIDDYNMAIKINHNYSEAYNNRGLAKYNLSDYTGAIEDYNMAVKFNPEYSEVYNNRGLAKYSLNDYSEAIADYTKAIKIDPNFDFAYGNRGSAKYNLKDFTGAIEDYNKAIKINPNLDMSYKNRGLAKYYLKDFAGAIDDYNMVIKINPNSSDTYFSIGQILGESRRYEEAILYFKKCIQLDPNNIKAYQNISFSYQNLKQPELSKLWFDKAHILQQKIKE